MKALVLIAGAIAATSALAVAAARSSETPTITRASFTPDGEVRLPVRYRQWVHVGTRYKPVSISILDGTLTKTPEIFNAYVEPSALEAYKKTGQWPDGAQFVKEFTAAKVGPGCDEKTLLCTTKFGVGIFETGYIGLGMMVKDAQRFPNAPGHWGYFSFGHKAPPYDPVSPVRATAQCGYCHVNLASKTDYVVSEAQVGLAPENIK